MPLKNSLSESTPLTRILILLIFMLIGTVIAMGIILVFIHYSFQLPFTFTTTLSSESPYIYVLSAKLVQIASQLGLFIFPAIALAYLVAQRPKNYLYWPIKPSLSALAWTGVITLFSIPFINILAQWNSQWHLPAGLNELENWMRHAQLANDQMLHLFMRDSYGVNLFVNILMMAVLPALGEEFIFRGVLQKELIKITKKPHLAIIITAILFSAIHLQFMGFFSRSILGALFGYLFYYSKNLWLPILAHFMNNLLALILAVYFGDSALAQNEMEVPWPMAVTSTMLFLMALLILYRYKGQLNKTIQ